MNFRIPLAAAALVLGVGLAVAPAGAVSLEITITNASPGQVLSAPVIASHSDQFHLFTVGEAASEELGDLAQDAVTDPLVALLQVDPAVLDVAVGGGNIPPGSSATITIEADAGHRSISLASMLVTTNDAFVGVDGLLLPVDLGHRRHAGPTKTTAVAYDAGAEDNSEDCAHIPGPPCDNPMVDNGPGEGFVAVHNGIHGIADLLPSRDDWRNPVAVIEVALAP